MLHAMFLLLATASAAEPCVSGPRVGQRPGPYSFVLCTGENRGKSHCYICEADERPMVILFLRSLGDNSGKLTSGLDKALAEYRKNELRVWVSLLHEDQSKIDSEVLAWVKKHSISTVPVGVFEDVEGPPSYRLHRDADVTVLLAVKKKVVVNAAFRKDELTEEKVKGLLSELPKITGPKLAEPKATEPAKK
jgi:hypothetical protein